MVKEEKLLCVETVPFSTLCTGNILKAEKWEILFSRWMDGINQIAKTPHSKLLKSNISPVAVSVSYLLRIEKLRAEKERA